MILGTSRFLTIWTMTLRQIIVDGFVIPYILCLDGVVYLEITIIAISHGKNNCFRKQFLKLTPHYISSNFVDIFCRCNCCDQG